MKRAKTYHNRASASIYCENISHYFRAQRPVKFCRRTVAMCVCVCVCVYEGVTDLQLESNGLSLSLGFILEHIHTEKERERSSSCDSFNRPRLYGPREGHPWVKGQTNFLSDLQAKQGWWQCSKNVRHKFSSETQPCSLQRRTEPAPKGITSN